MTLQILAYEMVRHLDRVLPVPRGLDDQLPADPTSVGMLAVAIHQSNLHIDSERVLDAVAQRFAHEIQQRGWRVFFEPETPPYLPHLEWSRAKSQRCGLAVIVKVGDGMPVIEVWGAPAS